MTAKTIDKGTKARDKLLRGIRVAADTVSVTLGPRGRNVIIEKSFGAPKITKDGVSVAKEIELEDKVENLGVQVLKEAANKTNDRAGDGTTTTIVLGESIAREGVIIQISYSRIRGVNSIFRQDILIHKQTIKEHFHIIIF